MRTSEFLPRFRRARAALAELEQREAWSRGEIEAFQLGRINTVWAHAVAHVPYYRGLARSHGLPARFDSLDEFRDRAPVLRKEVVRADVKAFFSERAPRGRWFSTGGSTGTPMRVFWSSADHQRAMQAKYRFYASHGIDLFDRTAFLWGAEHRFSPGLRGRVQQLREWVLDRLRNRRRFSAYRLDDAQLRRYLREMEAFGPAMLYGFGRAVHLLAREAERTGFRCAALRLVVVSSEVVTPAMAAAMERGFGVPVASEYGAAECPIIAGTAADGALRVREDLVMVETPKRGDGRCDVVLTVFGNTAFPLFRYAIEDVVDVPVHHPPAGFAALGPVSGRDDELLLTGAGGPVHPAAVDAVFEREPAVRRYRVHQAGDGSIRACLQLDCPLSNDRRAELERELAALLDRPTRLEVVEHLAPTPAGKHRAITSELTRAAG